MVVTNKQLEMMINNAVLDGSYYKWVDWDGIWVGQGKEQLTLLPNTCLYTCLSFQIIFQTKQDILK